MRACLCASPPPLCPPPLCPKPMNVCEHTQHGSDRAEQQGRARKRELERERAACFARRACCGGHAGGADTSAELYPAALHSPCPARHAPPPAIGAGRPGPGAAGVRSRGAVRPGAGGAPPGFVQAPDRPDRGPARSPKLAANRRRQGLRRLSAVTPAVTPCLHCFLRTQCRAQDEDGLRILEPDHPRLWERVRIGGPPARRARAPPPQPPPPLNRTEPIADALLPLVSTHCPPALARAPAGTGPLAWTGTPATKCACPTPARCAGCAAVRAAGRRRPAPTWLPPPIAAAALHLSHHLPSASLPASLPSTEPGEGQAVAGAPQPPRRRQ